MRVLTALALNARARCRSGEAPVFMRVLTTSPDCTSFRWGSLAIGPGLRRLGGSLTRSAISFPQIGELPGIKRVAPAPLSSIPVLPPRDPQRVQQAGQPPGALHPLPSRSRTERLEQVGRHQHLAPL